MFQLGRFRLDLIADGSLDVEDFPLQRTSTGDWHSGARRRIRLAFNGLLVRGEGRTVVIDPGAGDKGIPDKRAQYRLEWPRRFVPSLAALGVACEAVDTVILTHLHWDHAGAATRCNGTGAFVPAFPNATYVVQAAELEAAREAVNTGDDSYLADDFEPLVRRGVLETVSGERDILPGVSVRQTGGHCPGLQIVLIESDNRCVFLSDLIPTTAQLPPDVALSFDKDHAALRAGKRRVLDEAVARRDLLLFVHAPRVRAGYLTGWHDGRPVFESVHI